jgi:hypothetical protein
LPLVVVVAVASVAAAVDSVGAASVAAVAGFFLNRGMLEMSIFLLLGGGRTFWPPSTAVSGVLAGTAGFVKSCRPPSVGGSLAGSSGLEVGGSGDDAAASLSSSFRLLLGAVADDEEEEEEEALRSEACPAEERRRACRTGCLCG